MSRISHISASVSASGGGISIALQALTRAQLSEGLKVRVVGQGDGGAAIGGWPPNVLRELEFRRMPGMRWSVDMESAIATTRPELLHAHGLWEQPSLVVPRCARRHSIPYVTSPHGMLDPWALANSKYKKRLAYILYERANLRSAGCLHALCESEARSLRAYGLRNPIAVIPNGVELPQDCHGESDGSAGTGRQRRVLLFLGRLHPKKGLVNALKAWSHVVNKQASGGGAEGWQFAIAGWDQGGHEAELKQLCDEAGLSYRDVPAAEFVSEEQSGHSEDSIVFLGSAFGEIKETLLRTASAFILPSFSEGLPMAVLEAWAYRLPVVMTDFCNLPEGFAAGAAIRIGTEVEDIAEGMDRLLNATSAELRQMAANGRQLAECRFAWPRIAKQMRQLYRWLLGGGEPPEFVEMSRFAYHSDKVT
jgi:glycosyltransferase involved in cell wall biosynthesis